MCVDILYIAQLYPRFFFMMMIGGGLALDDKVIPAEPVNMYHLSFIENFKEVFYPRSQRGGKGGGRNTSDGDDERHKQASKKSTVAGSKGKKND